METHGLRRVCVWLDELAPDRGAFAHALEWACEIGLPLQGVLDPSSPQSPSYNGLNRDSLERRRASCRAACEERGVAWEMPVPGQDVANSMEELFGPGRLGVFGNYLPLALKQALLVQSRRRAGGPILIASPKCQAVSRLLVLHGVFGRDDDFLDAAAALCQTIHAAPVVLTVAGTETKARQGQERAQEVLARHQLDADFDFLVGGDIRLGVAAAAGWRHSAHLVVPQHRTASWWHWFRPGIIEYLLRLPDSLTLLALPPSAALKPTPASQGLELAQNERK